MQQLATNIHRGSRQRGQFWLNLALCLLQSGGACSLLAIHTSLHTSVFSSCSVQKSLCSKNWAFSLWINLLLKNKQRNYGIRGGHSSTNLDSLKVIAKHCRYVCFHNIQDPKEYSTAPMMLLSLSHTPK